MTNPFSDDTYRLMVSWDFEVFEFDNNVECIDYVSFFRNWQIKCIWKYRRVC